MKLTEHRLTLDIKRHLVFTKEIYVHLLMITTYINVHMNGSQPTCSTSHISADILLIIDKLPAVNIQIYRKCAQIKVIE